jgi:hypothetical protein
LALNLVNIFPAFAACFFKYGPRNRMKGDGKGRSAQSIQPDHAAFCAMGPMPNRRLSFFTRFDQRWRATSRSHDPTSVQSFSITAERGSWDAISSRNRPLMSILGSSRIASSRQHPFALRRLFELAQGGASEKCADANGRAKVCGKVFPLERAFSSLPGRLRQNSRPPLSCPKKLLIT